MVERHLAKVNVASSNLVFRSTSEWTALHSDFSFMKNRRYAPSFLLFRKRSRSRRLFACKRTHNALGSLPTFCDCTAKMRIMSQTHGISEWTALHSDFSFMKNRRYAPSFSFNKRRLRLRSVRIMRYGRGRSFHRCLHIRQRKNFLLLIKSMPLRLCLLSMCLCLNYLSDSSYALIIFLTICPPTEPALRDGRSPL